MSQTIDNLIALRILSMLVTPFEDSEAFKLGIIDKNGKKIKKPISDNEKDSYNNLTKLVFNLKKILNKLPGGDTRIKNLTAALFLVKENLTLDTDEYVLEQNLIRIINSNIILAEETILVDLFMEEGEGIANVSMPADGSASKVSTDVPLKKLIKGVARRPAVKLTTVN